MIKEIKITATIGRYRNGIYFIKIPVNSIPFENANVETILSFALDEIREILKREFTNLSI